MDIFLQQLNFIYYFVMVLSFLICLRELVIFLLHLIASTPTAYKLSNTRLLILGLSISYLTTTLII